MTEVLYGSIFLLVLYALICIGIGLWNIRKQSDQDYLLAGRKLNTFSFVATIVASYVGGAALVAYTAFVYEFGISALWIYIGTAAGFLAFGWYALRIRREGKKKNFHTLSDWINDKIDKKVAVLAAVLVLIVYFGWLINQFVVGSTVLAGISGLSYEMSLLFSGGIILIYLALGGFKSVVRTDIFQYLVLFLLALVLGFALFGETNAITPELLNLGNAGLFLSLAFIIYGVAIVFAGSEYWQRVYAAEDEKTIKKGLIWSAIMMVIIGLILSILGLVASTQAPGLDANQAAIYALGSLLPTALIGLALVLVFAAVMSSADTLIFVLSLSLAKDYFGPAFHKKIGSKGMVKITRISIVAFSILGVGFAYFFRDIIQIVLTVGGVLLALVPVVVASFHWRIKPMAAFLSLLAGIVYVLYLVLSGTMIPELAAASIIISGVVLAIGQVVFRHKPVINNTIRRKVSQN